MELGHFMERHYTARGRYMDRDGNGPTLPFDTVPRDASTENYILGYRVSEFSYTLGAAPVNEMLGDRCSEFSLSEQGLRTPENCW